MTYKTEFPEFESEIPPVFLAAPWQDVSWHNDACPSFMQPLDTVRGVVVYVDEAAPEKRGIEPAGPRYCVFLTDAEGCMDEDAAAVETEDLAAVFAYISEVRA